MLLFPTAGDGAGTFPLALPRPCKLDPIPEASLPEEQLAPLPLGGSVTPSRRNGQPPHGSLPALTERAGDQLRSWIDHVLVPILLRELLREKNLKGDKSDG